MRKTQLASTKSTGADASVPTARLPRLIDSWLLAGDINRHSERTLEQRRDLLGKLVWFLNQRELSECGTHELRLFLHYVTHGHKEPGGRCGGQRAVR